jgi:hypothetical protein
MLLSADAVYLPEFQYEALKKFLFLAWGEKKFKKDLVVTKLYRNFVV